MKYQRNSHAPLSLYIPATATPNPQHTKMEITRPCRPRPPKDLICRKHPKHGQSPGVCSVCLMEKLSQLYTASVSSASRPSSCSSSSLSPLSSSSEVSSCSSPSHRRVQALSGDRNGLMMKSRSVAFITRRRRAVEDDGKGKAAGFWSKLLRRKKNRVNERLMHSKTTRERVAVV